MEQAAILVDTSAWISYLQPAGDKAVRESVKQALTPLPIGLW